MTIREHAEAIERESLQEHPVWFVARQHARAIIDALDACGFVNYGPLSQPPDHYKIIIDQAAGAPR